VPSFPRFDEATWSPQSYPAAVFERFTDRARKIVVFAQEEARLLKHDYIGTEHLLLGLIREGEGVAAKTLESMGISLEAIRSEVVGTVGEGDGAPSGHIPFTARAKKVLELSLREALQLGHDYIGTEHILLGLIREGEGVAAQVLGKLGADLDRVRASVNQLVSGMGIVPSSEVAPAEEFPTCPVCSAPLPATLRIRTIDVEEGGEIVHARVAHCGRCGSALGIA
jgi:ATP-dependent Clp protease ATP-binding subunit ClpC